MEIMGFLANFLTTLRIVLAIDLIHKSVQRTQWEWKRRQEGSPWNNKMNLADATRVIDSVFKPSKNRFQIEHNGVPGP